MQRLNKFLLLPAKHKWLLVEAAVWLARARLTLALRPFRRVLDSHVRLSSLSEINPSMPEKAWQVAWAVELAARYLPGHARCLPQALAGQRLLARRGIASTLCIGLARDPDKQIAAHAWLRAGGYVVLGGPDVSHFTCVTEIPGPGNESTKAPESA